MGGRTGVSPNRSETSRRRGGAPEPVEEASGEEIGPHGHRESFRGDGKSHRAASRREGGGGTTACRHGTGATLAQPSA
jgi:hypothetical protein